ncbi:Wzz/FepE/Etk N-terminal domain-containing protein [Litoribacter populi]|uniref:Wzz/FepE/Etk N-terminal domain-containing protein n=1 Tax=Litoribacter populi TaxID=2598460 RepID=UPI00117CCC64|nr:Wzz/FepE/Etk N-terminal domain-containing protein [Litoribacter populi]
MGTSVRQVFSGDKIKLVDLILLVFKKWIILVISVCVFIIGGLIISLTSTTEYEATTVILSEYSPNNQLGGIGQLGNLAGIAGLNLQGSGTQVSLTPEFYPEIIQSRPFLLGLIKEEFYFSTKDKTMSIQQFYLEDRPDHAIKKFINFFRKIPNVIKKSLSKSEVKTSLETPIISESNNTISVLLPEEGYAIGLLKDRIDIDIDKRKITLKVKNSDPRVAAELNTVVEERIIQYVTEYQINKQRRNVEFIEERANEAELNFQNAQNTLAAFRDANQGIVSQRARTKEEQLQAEFNIAFNVYNTLKQEAEQARIQLKKDTPVFTAFEPVLIPSSPSDPNIFRILILSFIAGSFIGFLVIGISLIVDYIRN